jgi:hypothetical protein
MPGDGASGGRISGSGSGGRVGVGIREPAFLCHGTIEFYPAIDNDEERFDGLALVEQGVDSILFCRAVKGEWKLEKWRTDFGREVHGFQTAGAPRIWWLAGGGRRIDWVVAEAAVVVA